MYTHRGLSPEIEGENMKAIVAADRNWGIGCGNKLLIQIPADMKNFRNTTMGNVVVMGRKTLESFPEGMPLMGRINIVLTRREDYDGHGAIVVHTVEELLGEIQKYQDKEIFVVGGGMVYDLLLPYCDTVYVTKIDFYYQADTWFPRLDQMPEWEMVWESEEQTCFDIEYYFQQYRRK